MKSFYYSLILLATLQKCTGQMPENNIIHIARFDETSLEVTSILKNQKSLLIGGRYLGTDSQDYNDSSFILKSTSNKDWVLKNLGKGQLHGIIEGGNSLYAIKYVKSNKNYGQTDSTIIAKSEDNGENWKDEMSFPFYVREILCTPNKSMFVVCRDQKNDPNQWKVLKSINLGKSWETIRQENVGNKLITSLEQETFFAISYSTGVCKIWKNEGESTSVEQLSLPHDFVLDCTTTVGKLIVLAGRIQNEINVYSFDLEDKSLENLNKLDNKEWIPESINYYKGTYSMIVNRVMGIGSQTTIFNLNDHIWTVKAIPIDHYFNPYCYFQNKVYAFSGLGRIQIVDLKN